MNCNRVPTNVLLVVQSFLLTFFLRYLRFGNPDDLSLDWMTESE